MGIFEVIGIDGIDDIFIDGTLWIDEEVDEIFFDFCFDEFERGFDAEFGEVGTIFGIDVIVESDRDVKSISAESGDHFKRLGWFRFRLDFFGEGGFVIGCCLFV